MKNYIKLLVCCVVLAITLAGCKSQASVIPPTTTEVNKDVSSKEIIHQEVIEVPKDSSYYQAYLDCVNGKVVIKQPEAPPPGSKIKVNQKGHNLKIPLVKITDNKLEVNCYQEAQRLFYTWKEIYTKEHTATTIKIPYSVKLPLTIWESTQIWFGRVFLVLLIVLLLLIIIRAITKFSNPLKSI